jgi:hypothetical protein
MASTEPPASPDEDVLAERPSNAADDTLALGDITIAALIDRFVRAPLATARALSMYLRAVQPTASEPAPVNHEPVPVLPIAAVDENAEPPSVEQQPARQRALPTVDAAAFAGWLPLGLRIVGLALALIGTATMAFAPVRTEEQALLPGLPFALAGMICWLAAGLLARGDAPAAVLAPAQGQAQPAGLSVPLTRIVIAAAGLMCSVLAFSFSVGNLFRPLGVITWIASVLLWVWAAAPQHWTPLYPLRRWAARLGLRREAGSTAIGLRISWVTLALVTIIGLGAAFRVSNLHNNPPEMTSDHVEKLLDSQRVFEGTTQIFFQNNGGREPLHMYVVAAFARITGQPITFDMLKLMTALAGIVTIPVMFWLGRELFYRYDRLLGALVGLALAALVAVSYWHVTLGRLSLRIIYTPMITALLFIYLTRALRDNRRIDWINAGLALGASLYMYQVARILPVVVAVSTALGLIMTARSAIARRQMLLNFLTLVLIAFAVFVPMFRFSVDYPEDFWRRTSGRLFGDEVTQTTDDQGNPVLRDPTISEMAAAFSRNLPQLLTNIRNALLMYTWKGDIAFVNAAPNRPAFDPVSGALLLGGLGGWLALMIRRMRDPGIWLILPAAFILLLPSALSIAYPIENPSATRMSGTLPEAYLLAAFAAALLLWSLGRALPRAAGALVSSLLVIAALASAYTVNANLVFREYRESYLANSKPYSDVGAYLRSFVQTGSVYGNTFMIGYPNWYDHRAIGIEAGRIHWPNGIVSRDDIPRFLRDAALRTDAFAFAPDFPLLFIYSTDDVDTELRLQIWFPDGQAQTIQSYQPEDSYRVFRAPPLGRVGFERFVAEYAPS